MEPTLDNAKKSVKMSVDDSKAKGLKPSDTSPTMSPDSEKLGEKPKTFDEMIASTAKAEKEAGAPSKPYDSSGLISQSAEEALAKAFQMSKVDDVIRQNQLTANQVYSVEFADMSGFNKLVDKVEQCNYFQGNRWDARKLATAIGYRKYGQSFMKKLGL